VVQDPAAAFLAALHRGESWFPALLQAVADWSAPEETWRGRHYTYLIATEAFDWLLLAERLLDEADGLVPEDERAKLLFLGEPPIPMNGVRFRAMIGAQKHSAHLNFLYGIVVEEALQQAALEEAAKARQSLGAREGVLEEEAFRRLYDVSCDDLLTEFRRTMGFHKSDDGSLEEQKAFTYWLFKRRVARSEPARLASDTRKGLRVLEALRPGAWRWTQSDETAEPSLEA
jgi:hypothetical protein